MRLNRDTALFHLTHLIPCEIALALAQETRDDKDRRLEVILFQNGKRIGIVIDVAIVKRDEHRTLGQRPRACQIVVELIGADCVIAMIDEILHLPVKIRWLNRKREEPRVDHVVVEHGHLHIVLGGRRR